jgi:hypothetical protein
LLIWRDGLHYEREIKTKEKMKKETKTKIQGQTKGRRRGIFKNVDMLRTKVQKTWKH